MSPLPTRRALDEFDFDGRRRLLRLVVEKVRVTGWHVEIHLKITLQADPYPNANLGHPSPFPDRQAIWACVPLMSITGDGYRLRRHRDAINARRPALTGRVEGGEFS